MRALHVLVVEDDAVSLDAVCEILQMLGHDTASAANTTQAMARLRADRFDVLLTDLNLAGGSGIELAQQAVAAYLHLWVIFASGDDLPDSVPLDFPSKGLRKPYAVDELNDALRAIQSASDSIGR